MDSLIEKQSMKEPLKHYMKYDPIEVPILERRIGKFGRVYVTPEGLELPSVTTVLSHKPNPSLDSWRASIGEAEATKIASRAAHRGTYIHSMCESLLKGTQPPPANMFYADMWESFRPVVEQIEMAHALETPLYSKYLGVAGTVDCVGIWKGRPAIIDFKTSSRVKFASDISSYFMQCAVYAVMWEERTKKPVTQLVVLMAVEDEDARIFIEHRDNWIKPFMLLREEYRKETGV